jgi:chlorobactene glucosyltransferase
MLLHAVLGACVAYAALCLALVLANAVLLPRLSRAHVEADGVPAEPLPLVSIVVPARDEEREIERAVGSLLAQDYPQPRLEVIVVNDRSTDRTGEILARLAARDPRLTVVDGVEPPPGWLGKPHALFEGQRAARGELLLFVDADIFYAPEAVRRAVAFLESRQADFLALMPRAEAVGFWENVLLPNLECAIYFAPWFLVTARRPRWLAPGGGAGNLVRRRAYDAVGGHETLRASVVDDVRLATEVKRAGFPTLLVIADDLVSVRIYRGFREVWNGFTKNVAYVLNGVLGIGIALWLVAWTVLTILPPVVLVAAWAGALVPAADIRRAALAWEVLVAARVVLSLVLRKPLWAALTSPLMAAVWAGLLVRSAWQRFVRRSLTWRGREFDARNARF